MGRSNAGSNSRPRGRTRTTWKSRLPASCSRRSGRTVFRPSGISPRQPAGWVARAAVVLCWLLAAQGAALAHAALIGSDPADGAVVATPPRQLTLTFSEPVSPLALKLVVAGGAATPLETYRIEGPALIVTPPELAQGTHGECLTFGISLLYLVLVVALEYLVVGIAKYFFLMVNKPFADSRWYRYEVELGIQVFEYTT